MITLSTEEAIEKLERMIQSITEDREQIRITSESGNVVMLSEDAYTDLMVTLELLATPGLMDEVRLRACE